MITIRYGDSRFRKAYGEAWSSHDEAHWRTYFTPDVEYIEGGTHTTYRGIDQAARFFRFMYRFASDSQIEFLNLHGNAEGFGSEWIWSGVADGPLMVDGVVHPPTNRSFRIDGAAMCRVDADGRVSYHKDYYDVRSMMKQLGLV
jgi:hypothetical protein